MLASPAWSQGNPVTLWSANGPSHHFPLFGSAIDGLGDLDGDGQSDWIVGAPTAQVSGSANGQATVYYSGGGAPVVLNGPLLGVFFGAAVSDAGDQNGDGLSEFLIGAPRWPDASISRGRVTLYDGATASVITHFPGLTPATSWGATICSLGDLNGDGKGEYAFNGDSAGPLAVYVMDGSNNQILYAPIQPGAAIIDIANAGDVSGDGINDIIVGMQAQTRVYSGATGAFLFSISGAATCVAGPGDVDGDGIADIAVGDGQRAGSLGGQQGFIGVYSGGAVGNPLIWSREGDGVIDELGISIVALGDVDLDGIGDLAAGAPERQSGFQGPGYVRVYSGVDGCVLAEYVGTQVQSSFGSEVANAGDLDGDGRDDLAIGNPTFDITHLDQGTAVVVKGQAAGASVGQTFCSCTIPGLSGCGNNSTSLGGCLNSTGQPGVLLGYGSASVAADDLFLVASGLPSNTPTLFFSGTQKNNGGFGTVLNDGLLCVSGTIVRLPAVTASAGGVAVKGPCKVGVQGGYLAGQTIHFQAQYRDVTGPCGTAANMTNALTVMFVP